MTRSTATLYVLTLIITVATAWAYHTPIDIAVEANGVVRPDGGTVRIVSDVSGRIIDVPVREGDHVSEGEVLLEVVVPGLAASRQSHTIVSPETGVIGFMTNLHVGEIVPQGSTIGTIIPDNRKLIVEAW